MQQILRNLGLLATGGIICAIAVNGILIPRGFVSGGVTGLALVIHYLVPGLSVGLVYVLLNVPLFLVGWKLVGRRFFLYSIVGMAIFAGTIQWVHIPIPVYDKMLSALLAGIIYGFGLGIVLKSAGSTGGTDILSVILIRKYSIRLGDTILVFNSGVLLIAAVMFSLENAMYTLLYMYVSSKILDLVVTGLSQRKAVMIVSPFCHDISQSIINEMNRGVTVIPARGGYSGHQGDALYTVITFRELSHLKKIIKRVDPDAFAVVTDTLEVMGYRIGNQPHW